MNTNCGSSVCGFHMYISLRNKLAQMNLEDFKYRLAYAAGKFDCSLLYILNRPRHIEYIMNAAILVCPRD